MKKIDYREVCHPAHPDFRLENSPFYLMAHADFDYHRDMNKVLKKSGVDRPIYRVMTVLREHGSANIGFLAERSLTKPNTASRIVERMVSKDLVSAHPDPSDSRVTQVALTKRGRNLLDSLTPVVGRQFQRAIDGVDDEDLERLVRVLQKISMNLKRLPIEESGDAPASGRLAVPALPAGQAWTLTGVGMAGTCVSRIEVTSKAGKGIRLRNRTASRKVREALKSAKEYLSVHGAEFVGMPDPRLRELIVQVHPYDGPQPACSSLGLLLAICSCLLNKPLRAGLIIVGELAEGALESAEQPAQFVESAVREGARAILMPIAYRRHLANVSDVVATRIEMLFYATGVDAFVRALRE